MLEKLFLSLDPYTWHDKNIGIYHSIPAIPTMTDWKELTDCVKPPVPRVLTTWYVGDIFSPKDHVENCPSLCKIVSSGWWYTYPSEKYESQLCQLGLLFPIYGKIHMFQTTNHSCFAGLWTLFFGQIIESVAADSFTTLLCLWEKSWTAKKTKIAKQN